MILEIHLGGNARHVAVSNDTHNAVSISLNSGARLPISYSRIQFHLSRSALTSARLASFSRNARGLPRRSMSAGIFVSGI